VETAISVTKASRNFADVVNRAHYQGMSFILVKGQRPVAQITPVAPQPKKAIHSAAALEEVLNGLTLGEEEATSWLHDLEQVRSSLQRPVRP
jgi:prevent-host-death family protein